MVYICIYVYIYKYIYIHVDIYALAQKLTSTLYICTHKYISHIYILHLYICACIFRKVKQTTICHVFSHAQQIFRLYICHTFTFYNYTCMYAYAYIFRKVKWTTI